MRLVGNSKRKGDICHVYNCNMTDKCRFVAGNKVPGKKKLQFWFGKKSHQLIYGI